MEDRIEKLERDMRNLLEGANSMLQGAEHNSKGQHVLGQALKAIGMQALANQAILQALVVHLASRSPSESSDIAGQLHHAIEWFESHALNSTMTDDMVAALPDEVLRRTPEPVKTDLERLLNDRPQP